MSFSFPGAEKEKSTLLLSQQKSRRPLNRLTIIPGTPSEFLNTSSPPLDAHPSLLASGSTLSSGSMLTSLRSSNQLTLLSLTPSKPTLLMTKLNCPSGPPSWSHPLQQFPSIMRLCEIFSSCESGVSKSGMSHSGHSD